MAVGSYIYFYKTEYTFLIAAVTMAFPATDLPPPSDMLEKKGMWDHSHTHYPGLFIHLQTDFGFLFAATQLTPAITTL